MKLAMVRVGGRASGVALALVCVCLLWICGVCGVARAESPSSRAIPVYVLSVWTNDADDQADALTQQLRSRVRQVQGWSLLDAPQSFETLAIALRCPPTPNQACLDRIGDHLHADHYVWGTLAKEKAGEVTADVHLWSRGKPQVEASETYSENLKDPSDDALRAIAQKLVVKVLGGSTPTGVLVLHAGSGRGAVLVDGASKGQLDEGTARINVPIGQHTVSVRLSGFTAESKPVTITEGTEEEVTVALTPVASSEAEGSPTEAEQAPSRSSGSPFPVRKVVAYSMIVAGAALLVGTLVEGLAWNGDKNSSNDDRANIPRFVTDVCTVSPMMLSPQALASAQDSCAKNTNAKSASTGAWITGLIGLPLVGAGVVLLVTDPGHASQPEPAQAQLRPASRPTVNLVPSFGPHSGGVGLRVMF